MQRMGRGGSGERRTALSDLGRQLRVAMAPAANAALEADADAEAQVRE